MATRYVYVACHDEEEPGLTVVADVYVAKARIHDPVPSYPPCRVTASLRFDDGSTRDLELDSRAVVDPDDPFQPFRDWLADMVGEGVIPLFGPLSANPRAARIVEEDLVVDLP